MYSFVDNVNTAIFTLFRSGLNVTVRSIFKTYKEILLVI